VVFNIIHINIPPGIYLCADPCGRTV